MKVKTIELIGAALDWAVLVAMYGKHDPSNKRHIEHFKEIRECHLLRQQARFSERWEHGGPIIERERISMIKAPGNIWSATIVLASGFVVMRIHDNPLVAAMRCYVAAKLGDVVEIPEELC
ncbi:MAG: DUF2591 domain-containing protein [Betaproteobacteria bacterium]|nr:DUF2591 domain-containing protein [Betaproteobacteria bacterium]